MKALKFYSQREQEPEKKVKRGSPGESVQCYHRWTDVGTKGCVGPGILSEAFKKKKRRENWQLVFTCLLSTNDFEAGVSSYKF